MLLPGEVIELSRSCPLRLPQGDPFRSIARVSFRDAKIGIKVMFFDPPVPQKITNDCLG
jgi:hypothetical protein